MSDKKPTAKEPARTKLRIAAVGDVHMDHAIVGQYQAWLQEVNTLADVLVLCGDLTNHGHAAEAELLVKELKACRVPIVAVLGNHDYTEGEEKEIMEILRQGGVEVLHYEPFIMGDVGFVGAKGFGGGFGTLMLSNFGEDGMRAFVREAVDEALLLEKDLHTINETPHKVAVLHYAPVRDTVVGEPEEIFPFLGSTRLAEPLDHAGVELVVHGHAHAGTFQGATPGGAPVHNVAMPILLRDFQKNYYIFEI